MKKNEKLEPLIKGSAVYSENLLDELLLAIARNIEDSLVKAGAKPGIDYSILDLYNLAQPFALQRMSKPFESVQFNLSFD